jgi:dipeptidyl aminopeptidase/acylaminoacyl peptidase
MRDVTLLALLLALLLPVTALAGDELPADDDDSAATGESEEVEPGPGPLIPRSLLFGNPDRAGAQISPDGQHISFVAPVDGVMNVWVGPTDDITAAKAITADKNRGIRNHHWSWDSRYLLYMQDKDGDENHHLYRVELATGDLLDLTPIDGIRAQVIGASRDEPGVFLVGINDRSERYHDVYRVQLADGARERILKNPRYAGFVVDERGQIRLAVHYKPDGSQEIRRAARKGKFKPWLEIPHGDTMTTRPVGFDVDGTGIYALDSRGRNTAALVHIDIKSGEQELILEVPEADISGVILHPTEQVPLFATSTRERATLHVLDDRFTADVELLQAEISGDIGLSGCSLDLTRCIVASQQDTAGVVYYLYDRAHKTVTELFPAKPELREHRLATMHSVTIPSRDGLDLVSYYSLPEWTDPDGDGRPDAPLPLVLWVHGGPWGRDGWGYHPVHQWVANRGAAVLSVNFRGSTGLGKDFINAGDREWAGKMHDDLLDGVAWAVEAGIAAEDQVVIGGGSFGGYATLVGLSCTPEGFAAGVDVVGPSSLVTLLQSIPPYWAPMRNVFKARVGDVGTAAGREELLARSPLTRADQIVRPLLIAQGANDPRVKQAESDQIVEVMQAGELPVTYVLYPDEGHGFARPENMTAFFAVTEAFLAPILGTRFEPIGDDLAESSLQAPAGRELVEGLNEALIARDGEPEAEEVEAAAPE